MPKDKKELTGPHGESEVVDMRDLWYGYSKAKRQNAGYKGPDNGSTMTMRVYANKSENIYEAVS